MSSDAEATKHFVPGIYPFWFWNSRLEESEIRWQIREMAAKGFGGFYIHSRQGLEQPYLSESFFQCVDVAVEEAEACGLSVHLYDEYPYPSGVAGGLVTMGQPEHLATRLVTQAMDCEPGPCRLILPVGQLLCCTAFPLRDEKADWENGIDLSDAVGVSLSAESYNETGLTQYNRKRYFASQPVPVLVTTFECPVRLCVAVQAIVEGHKYWGHFADVMRVEVVQAFLQKTHESYRQRYRERFGTSILSVFTDETTPGWSSMLPGAFRQRYGYEFRDALPAIMEHSHPRHDQTCADFQALQLDCFIESFEKPIGDWCRQNSLLYGGEKPSWRLSQLRFMDLPGCEPGHTKAGKPEYDFLSERSIRGNARAVSSAAYFYDKPGALCECYHSMGWSATLQDAKLVGEALILMGITHLVPHGAFYTTHALKKHDAPPSFFFQMPYWQFFGVLSRHFQMLLDTFSDTWIDAKVLILDPHAGLPDSSDLALYKQILDQLLTSHVDFLMVDTDILETACVDGAVIGIRDVKATCLIVPPMRVVESELTAWLERYEAQGGCVLKPRTGKAIREGIRPLPKSLGFTCDEGDGGDVFVVCRRGDGVSFWFILNWSDETRTLRFESKSVREIPLTVGSSRQENQNGLTMRRLAPFESLLLSETDSGEEVEVGRARLELDIPEQVEIEPGNINQLRMEPWELSVDGETAIVKAVPLANQLADGGFVFKPDLKTSFGGMPEWKQPQMELCYRYRFENRFEGNIHLLMEPGSLVGEWSIAVNGGPPVIESDFQPTEMHVRGSVAVDISSRLTAGANRIEVVIVTDRLDGGLLNPLYLAGDFAVRLDGPALESLPLKGGFEDWDRNGLPYFAGVLVYRGDVQIDTVPEGEWIDVEMGFPAPYQDSCEVSLNDGPWRPCLWSPYVVRVPGTEIRAGINRVAIRTYTGLVRVFDGLRFDPGEHSYQPVGQSS